MTINFSDFWPGFNPENNFITSILTKRSVLYKITETVHEADIVFFSMFGKSHLNSRGLKIFYSGESTILPEYMFDFCISMNTSRKSNFYYLPHWAVWDEPKKILEEKLSFEEFKKKKDCCIIIGNPNALDRINFYNCLSKYIQVDSGGSFMNNVGKVYLLPEKHKFISDYKFIICFENRQLKGYCTEKLFEAMCCNVIPIYFGDPNVGIYFNENSFVNIQSSRNFDQQAKMVAELLHDENKLKDLWEKSWVNHINYEEFLTGEKFETFILNAISTNKKQKIGLNLILSKMYYIKESVKYRMKKWFI